jgi:hypothetical protein
LRKLAPKAGDFDRLIEDATTPEDGQTTETHRALLDLQPRGIVTWNYDDAHENSLQERGQCWKVLDPWNESLLVAIRSGLREPFLLKAHGSVGNRTLSGEDLTPYHSVVLSSESYRDIAVRQPAYRGFMQHIFTNFNLLIVGFGMADPDFDLLLGQVFGQYGFSIQTHVLIRVASEQEETKGQEVRLRRDHGIRTLYTSAITQNRPLSIT